MERTLIIIKPDAIQRGLTGEIIRRFEQRGLKLVGMRFLQASQALAEEHYSIHRGKPFFEGTVAYITSSPVVIMVFEGTNAVIAARGTVGATKPQDAAPGSIRGDLGLEIGRNLVHASDSVENAQTEIALWFGPHELIEWHRNTDRWVYEKP